MADTGSEMEANKASPQYVPMNLAPQSPSGPPRWLPPSLFRVETSGARNAAGDTGFVTCTIATGSSSTSVGSTSSKVPPDAINPQISTASGQQEHTSSPANSVQTCGTVVPLRKRHSSSYESLLKVDRTAETSSEESESCRGTGLQWPANFYLAGRGLSGNLRKETHHSSLKHRSKDRTRGRSASLVTRPDGSNGINGHDAEKLQLPAATLNILMKTPKMHHEDIFGNNNVACDSTREKTDATPAIESENEVCATSSTGTPDSQTKWYGASSASDASFNREKNGWADSGSAQPPNKRSTVFGFFNNRGGVRHILRHRRGGNSSSSRTPTTSSSSSQSSRESSNRSSRCSSSPRASNKAPATPTASKLHQIHQFSLTPLSAQKKSKEAGQSLQGNDTPQSYGSRTPPHSSFPSINDKSGNRIGYLATPPKVKLSATGRLLLAAHHPMRRWRGPVNTAPEGSGFGKEVQRDTKIQASSEAETAAVSTKIDGVSGGQTRKPINVPTAETTVTHAQMPPAYGRSELAAASTSKSSTPVISVASNKWRQPKTSEDPEEESAVEIERISVPASFKLENKCSSKRQSPSIGTWIGTRPTGSIYDSASSTHDSPPRSAAVNTNVQQVSQQVNSSPGSIPSPPGLSSLITQVEQPLNDLSLDKTAGAYSNTGEYAKRFARFPRSAISSIARGNLPPIPPAIPGTENCGPFLGPQPESVRGKPTLILDLDETLIHSSFVEVRSYSFVIPVDIDGHIHQIYVSKRPGVDQFLKAMAEKYEIVIFTASLAKYAHPLMNQLDPHRYCVHRLFREKCVFWNGFYVKDLTRIGRDIKRMVIVDNSPNSYAFQPENAIPISSWFSDKSDEELYHLTPVLSELASVEDIPVAIALSLTGSNYGEEGHSAAVTEEPVTALGLQHAGGAPAEETSSRALNQSQQSGLRPQNTNAATMAAVVTVLTSSPYGRKSSRVANSTEPRLCLGQTARGAKKRGNTAVDSSKSSLPVVLTATASTGPPTSGRPFSNGARAVFKALGAGKTFKFFQRNSNRVTTNSTEDEEFGYEIIGPHTETQIARKAGNSVQLHQLPYAVDVPASPAYEAPTQLPIATEFPVRAFRAEDGPVGTLLGASFTPVQHPVAASGHPLYRLAPSPRHATPSHAGTVGTMPVSITPPAWYALPLARRGVEQQQKETPHGYVAPQEPMTRTTTMLQPTLFNEKKSNKFVL